MKSLKSLLAVSVVALLSAAPAWAQVKLAYIGEISGQLAVSGGNFRDGVVLAVEEINAAGGILGKKIEPVVEDGASDPAVFADIRQKIAHRTRGFLAPEYNIRCIEAAATLPFDEGLAVERKLLGRMQLRYGFNEIDGWSHFSRGEGRALIRRRLQLMGTEIMRIFVFDDQGETEEEQAKPLHQFDYTAKSMALLGVEGELGETYRVFVPYTRPGNHRADCALRVAFVPEDGLIVILLLVEHLDIEPVQHRAGLIAVDEGHARPADPAVARAVPLAAEAAARRQRFDNPPPQLVKPLRLAKRHGEAGVYQAQAQIGRAHV